MRRFLRLFAFGFLLLNFSCDQEKDSIAGLRTGNLFLSSAEPSPGSSIAFEYFPESSLEQPPKALLVTLIGDQSYMSDVSIEPTEKSWEGQIEIPDSARAFALNFKVNNRFDTNNDRGYVFALKDKDGRPVAGSKSSIGIFFLGYGRHTYGIKADKDSVMNLIAEDLENIPELKEQFELNYPGVLMQHDPEKAKKYISNRINFYENKGTLTNDNYEALVYLYRLNGQLPKSDSIRAEGLRKFPEGGLAQQEAFQKFQNTLNLNDKEILLTEFGLVFGKESDMYDRMARNLALDYGGKGEYDKMLDLMEETREEYIMAKLLNDLLWTKAQKEKDLEVVDQLLEDYTAKYKSYINNFDTFPPHFSEDQFKEFLAMGLANLYRTSALVNYKKGNLNKAIQFQEKAAKNENADANTTTEYVKYLLESGDLYRSMAKAEEFITENRGTTEMEGYLRTAYLKSNGSLDGYNDYFNELKSAVKTQIKAEILKTKLNKKAPEFALLDLDGNTIDLESLRGKTVFLDFWATWCGPCKASFPALKTAMEKYSDAPDVAFFFINTMENPPGRHDIVEAFINDNEYPFQVLFDEPREASSNKFRVAEGYGIDGIPAKIIIGPQGNILFHHVGYDGNDSKLIDEIEVMIELSRNGQIN